MARIRTIKPEFWDSPSTARASAVARLAFIALWNWADDYGRGTANLKELEGFIFPNDDIVELSSGNTAHFRDVLAEIADAFGVVFYTVHGRPYFDIPSWDEHQRNERRAKASKHPGPDHADPETPGNTGKNGNDSVDAALFRPTVAEIPHTSGTGTGEQGNRGTGEQTNTCSPAPPSSERVTRFDEFWSTYPRKVGKQKARTKYQAAARRADEQTIIDGAHRLAHDPNLPEAQFIPHPTTWLERDGWEDEPLAPRRLTSSDDRMQAGLRVIQNAGQAQAFQNPFEGREIES